jgi:hypothetical protein
MEWKVSRESLITMGWLPTGQTYTFFSATCGTLSKINHMLGQEERLSKCKKIQITHCILSDHNSIKLELTKKSNSRKYGNNCRLNSLDHRRNKRGNQKCPRS